ncbi:cellulose biosynthesis protein BcsE [Vibrio splendidus]|uniref:cellulose biosynthesis protein BcsE n=1 Tax=Vibrio splendidus TaxID=29497 RepID=UPI000D3C73A9|nr:cellulose biosynthesis protein BcsE [Vibrio splendidus]PTO90255.1 cellulose biosynthesis protein BcsE [Vibrio splendidus]PTP32150.1 cellulose biosynthesis protein BcsE [Vibrio splendidus]PTP50351.1 cellulose biosynthesis protein BcsE [Vibrio splendidus]
MHSIHGLPVTTSEREYESVYVNLFTHKRLAIDSLFNLLINQDNTSLTIFTDKETFLTGITDEVISKINNLANTSLDQMYFVNTHQSKKTINPILLSRDIHKINIKTGSTYVLFIHDSLLAHSNDNEINEFLRNIEKLSINKNLAISLCIYGHLATSVLKPKLLTNNRHIAGLATMTPIDESTYNYLVDFWSNKHGVKSDSEYILTSSNSHQLKATLNQSLNSTGTTEDRADNERIYASKEVLGEGVKAPKSVHLANDNQTLLSMIDSPRASTVIFSCGDQSEVRQLAIDCYRLRAKAGNQLKIVIRETSQCLRYTDEKFLLRAGVNLICPVQVPHMRFMTQVEAIQGQVSTRSLPKNVESLLKYDLKFGNKGYLLNKEFTNYCSDVFAISSRSSIRFALIKLNLLPGMTPEECLRLCHIRRDGDIVTACNNALYVLFSAIRHNDINVALNNIFEFPIRDLFHTVQTYDTQHDIEAELQNIIEDQTAISPEVSKLTTEQKIFSDISQPIADITPLFAIKTVIASKGNI